MKLAVVAFFALLACVYASMLQPHPYYGWPFLSQFPNVVYQFEHLSTSVTSPVVVPSESAPEYGPNGRLFFNLVNSLLTTTTTTTTTITSTCTVSTGTNCGGKKRSIMWREEDNPHENEREVEGNHQESPKQSERKEREGIAYPSPFFVQSSVGHMPFLPSPSLFYDPHVQAPAVVVNPGNANARLFFFAFTSTVTVSTTTTSRSTPTCSSSSSFPTC